ncbi:hypothetical protein GCM10010406_21070 [Streptomyces thermolineatus]|uniref:Uncharacterized protein n=1 Tax=Streptomyces thermolineatus TaxID=44033 RepID=A0ABP5YSA1_9ACTN
MATLNPQPISLTGAQPTYAAASADGDKVRPDERTWLHVRNGGAGPVTVTLDATGSVRGQTVPDLTVTVPAGEDREIGPLTADLLAGTSDGLVAVTYSAVDSVTVAARRI